VSGVVAINNLKSRSVCDGHMSGGDAYEFACRNISELQLEIEKILSGLPRLACSSWTAVMILPCLATQASHASEKPASKGPGYRLICWRSST
jgi:hypothetical protein